MPPLDQSNFPPSMTIPAYGSTISDPFCGTMRNNVGSQRDKLLHRSAHSKRVVANQRDSCIGSLLSLWMRSLDVVLWIADGLDFDSNVYRGLPFYSLHAFAELLEVNPSV